MIFEMEKLAASMGKFSFGGTKTPSAPSKKTYNERLQEARKRAVRSAAAEGKDYVGKIDGHTMGYSLADEDNPLGSDLVRETSGPGSQLPQTSLPDRVMEARREAQEKTFRAAAERGDHTRRVSTGVQDPTAENTWEFPRRRIHSDIPSMQQNLIQSQNYNKFGELFSWLTRLLGMTQ